MLCVICLTFISPRKCTLTKSSFVSPAFFSERYWRFIMVRYHQTFVTFHSNYTFQLSICSHHICIKMQQYEISLQLIPIIDLLGASVHPFLCYFYYPSEFEDKTQRDHLCSLLKNLPWKGFICQYTSTTFCYCHLHGCIIWTVIKKPSHPFSAGLSYIRLWTPIKWMKLELMDETLFPLVFTFMNRMISINLNFSGK